MSFRISRSFMAAIAFAAFAATAPVQAQEVSESHLSAARKAINATKATQGFDSILFNASSGLKNRLTAVTPNKADEISAIVDEEALALAPRRGDLEGEAARLFANTFTEQELNDIAQFFGSEAGSKYLQNTPFLARELGKSARVWANGIARDLQVNVNKRLNPEGSSN